MSGPGRCDGDRRHRADGVSGTHRHGERRRARRRNRPHRRRRFRTLEDAERFKRSMILRPELEAAKVLRPDAPELSRLAAAGVTTVLATPTAGLFKGQSALVNVAAPVDEPQIGAVADPRKGLQIVGRRWRCTWRSEEAGAAAATGVAAWHDRVRPPELPRRAASAAGEAALRATKTGVTRPAYDPSLDAIQPALARACRWRSRPSCPRDPARAEHGEGIQPGSGDHRRA